MVNISETTRRDWFRRLRNSDVNVEDKKRAGKTKLVENEKLEALLDIDPCQMPEELAESLGVVQTAISMCLKA